jgi:hypothetical protein
MRVVAVASSTKPMMIFLANILQSPRTNFDCAYFDPGLKDVTDITESAP